MNFPYSDLSFHPRSGLSKFIADLHMLRSTSKPPLSYSANLGDSDMHEPIEIHHKDSLLAQIKCNGLWLPCCVDRKDYNSYLEFQVVSMYRVDITCVRYC